MLDFITVADELTFMRGQKVGSSSCIDIRIIQDIFVEPQETFEVMLLPNPNDLFGAIIQPSKAKAIVTISDGQMDRSMCTYAIPVCLFFKHRGRFRGFWVVL